MRDKLLERGPFNDTSRYKRSNTVFLLRWWENRKSRSRAPDFRRYVCRHSELILRARSRLIGMSVYWDRTFPRATTLTSCTTRTAGPEKVLLYNTSQGAWFWGLDSSVSKVTGCGFDDRRYNRGKGKNFCLHRHVHVDFGPNLASIRHVPELCSWG
jgi:hypothetical protein